MLVRNIKSSLVSVCLRSSEHVHSKLIGNSLYRRKFHFVVIVTRGHHGWTVMCLAIRSATWKIKQIDISRNYCLLSLAVNVGRKRKKKYYTFRQTNDCHLTNGYALTLFIKWSVAWVRCSWWEMMGWKDVKGSGALTDLMNLGGSWREDGKD